MNPFQFLILSLVVWRFTHLLAKEDGPWDGVVRFRKLFGQGFFGSLLDCFYCLSLWIALPLGLWAGQALPEKLLLWFAFSGSACLLEKFTEKNG